MTYEQYRRMTWAALGEYLASGRCDDALIDICKRYDVQAQDVRDMLSDCLE
jgi:hypothetical protein